MACNDVLHVDEEAMSLKPLKVFKYTPKPIYFLAERVEDIMDNSLEDVLEGLTASVKEQINPFEMDLLDFYDKFKLVKDEAEIEKLQYNDGVINIIGKAKERVEKHLENLDIQEEEDSESNIYRCVYDEELQKIINYVNETEVLDEDSAP